MPTKQLESGGLLHFSTYLSSVFLQAKQVLKPWSIKCDSDILPLSASFSISSNVEYSFLIFFSLFVISYKVYYMVNTMMSTWLFKFIFKFQRYQQVFQINLLHLLELTWYMLELFELMNDLHKTGLYLPVEEYLTNE